MKYAVVVEQGETSFGAHVPDLPGCVAVADTRSEVLKLIQEAIQFHIEGLREDGLPVPRPSHRTVTPRRKTREIDFYATVEIAA